MSTRKTYRIAKGFAMDHWDRNCGQTDEVLSQNKVWFTVSMDVDGFRDMLTDAEYYVDCANEMDGLEGICASAKRVLAALLKQGAPDGYKVVRKGSYGLDVVPVD